MQYRHSVSLRRSLLATSLLCAFAPAFAEEAAPQATNLDDVVVTATRTAQTQDATLAAITVIDRSEIERLQPTSVLDLLRGTPGLSYSNAGGPGKATSVFLRGTESGHVLVLVDGVKIGSATLGTASLQDIPVEQIERIEIVRGPFSSLYGSDALGGVIQIFTRRPKGGFVPHFSAAIGSYGTQRHSAGVGGNGEQGWYSVNAAHENTDGINARNLGEPDRDGYRNSSLTLQGGYRFGEQWDVEARAFRAEGESEFDGFLADSSAEFVQQAASARVRYAPSEAFALTLNGGSSDDQSDNFSEGTLTSTFDTHRLTGSLQGDLRLGGALVSLGYDWRRDEVDSTTTYAEDSRTNRGVFGQWQQTFGAHSLQASARRDDDSQFGGKTTGSALWGWNFTEALRLTASYGTAYKAPTFNDLYFPGFGNPDLTPETSRSIELGLRGKHGWGNWSVNTFDTKVDDLITIFCTPTWDCEPVNTDRARLKGTEVTADTSFAGWDLRASATLLDPRNDTEGKQNQLLPRRAKRSARIDADRRFGDFSVGASVYGAGARVESFGGRLAGYSTTDVRLGYTFGEAWSLQLAANNVFDKEYETASSYNQPGRNYLLTLRYQPAK